MLVAERLSGRLAEALLVDGLELYVGASIGIAFGHRRRSPEAIIRDADQTMYRAKGEGQPVRAVVPIGEWVISEATRQLADWRRAGLCTPDLAMSVTSPGASSSTVAFPPPCTRPSRAVSCRPSGSVSNSRRAPWPPLPTGCSSASRS